MKKLTEEVKKNLESKDALIEAQKESLIELSKQLTSMQQLNDNLKKQVENLTKELNWGETRDLESLGDLDAEIICKKQIENLKTISNERNFTLEETKKLETFVKVLTQIRKGVDEGEAEIKKLSEGELLQLVDGGKE